MIVGELVTELEHAGVRLWEESGQLRFRAPRGAMTEDRRAALRAHKDAVLDLLRRGTATAVVPELAARNEPFPLTHVQSAYLLGRRDAFSWGGVSCQWYGEIAVPELDPARLEAAWRTLIGRHDMLRAVVSTEGFQRVLAEVPEYHVRVNDVRGVDEPRVASAIETIRAEMDHRVYKPDEWPLFDLAVTLTDRGALLHFSIDFLIADFVSLQRLFTELTQRYADPEHPLPPLTITFRDYLLAERRLRKGGRWERDRAYWWQRIDALPGAPELPVIETPSDRGRVRFRRLQTSLPPAEWGALRRGAAAGRLTASGVVLAAYAEAIGRWSRQPRFSMNLTLLNRLPLHDEVEWLVGDFTSLVLLEVEHDPTVSFQERARALQAQLWQDMDHRFCSGVEVIREIARRRGQAAALMPIVFTSTLGASPRGGDGELFGRGELAFGISQTPQVWVDCQVSEHRGGLIVNWDVREGVFPEGIVDDMFAAFEAFLRGLATRDEVCEARSPVPLPAAQRDRRRRVNATSAPLPDGLLHDGVVAQARRTPERLAVASGRRSLTYGDLLARAEVVATRLHGDGSGPHDVLAVCMDKGWEQVVGVLGTLLAGAAYLPIDTNQPWARRNQMLTDAGVRRVLTQSWLVDADGWPEGIARIAVDALPPSSAAPTPPARVGSPDDLAYLIYTSGSTGSPKGVEITHLSARNTIDDINRRWHVGANDRVLGLANLGFDLSVYDVFGPLALGGCLVLPDPQRRRDPSHWAALVAEHGVTLWNSVPAQLLMLHDFLSTDPTLALPSLRLALLSGDWIPVTLPDRIRRRLPGLDVVSLGGATEAAIWSIAYPIATVSPQWRSIPYGKPLANQTFDVLDAALRPCPDWTVGELYIGGVGLARGYHGDEAKTAARFIRHPETGARLYRTGDLGRYLPDGNIEFLGREDSQVKVRGHRIELAEVAAAIRSHPTVASASVLTYGDDPMERRIAAFVESVHRAESEPAAAGLAPLAAEILAMAAAVRGEADCPSHLELHRRLDDVALLAMLHALRQAGLFATPTDAPTLDEVLRRAGVVPKHHRLVRRWLRALEEHGLLRREPTTGGYRCERLPDGPAVDDAWDRVEALPAARGRGSELVRYFRASARELPALLRGERDPLELLFPEGRVGVSEAVYGHTLAMRYCNRLLTATVRRIAAGRPAAAPLRVLEVGAGVGTTSRELIPALAGLPVEYVFTDVSPFFLNQARERFAAYPSVRFGLLDLEKGYRAQGFMPNSFDVIVAADVLHGMRHVGRALDRLRELLVPAGWLVLVEMTRDHYPILTSLELMLRLDGAFADFEDARQGRDQTFFDRRQWLALLDTAGGETVLCLPRPDDEIEQLGMLMLAARFKGDRARLDVPALIAHLTERLPEYMIPSHLQVVDALPLSENGKVDQKTLGTWLPQVTAEHVATGGGEPCSELERCLAVIWAEVLGVERVGRDQDFFELGGDSLLAAQIAGRMLDHVPEASSVPFDSLLRELLDGPTVATLASYLGEGAPEVESTTPCSQPWSLVSLGGEGNGAVRVIVPDGGAALESYRALAGALASGGPVVGLGVADAEACLRVEPPALVDWLADGYARALLGIGSRFHVVGHHLGGILAVEVARRLMEAGATIETLTLLGPHRVARRIDDPLLVEYLFAEAMGVDPVRLGYPADAGLMARAVGVVLATTGDHVPDGALAALDGDPGLEEVARCLRRLGERSPEERMATIGAMLGASDDVASLHRVFQHGTNAVASHEVPPYAGDITLVRAGAPAAVLSAAEADATSFWVERCLGEVRVVNVAGAHRACLEPPHVARLAEIVLATALTTGCRG